jgi:hypothetical protein
MSIRSPVHRPLSSAGAVVKAGGWRVDEAIVGLLKGDLIGNVLKFVPLYKVAQLAKVNSNLKSALQSYLDAEKENDPRTVAAEFMRTIRERLVGVFRGIFTNEGQPSFDAKLRHMQGGVPCLQIDAHGADTRDVATVFRLRMMTAGRDWVPGAPGWRWWIRAECVAHNKNQIYDIVGPDSWIFTFGLPLTIDFTPRVGESDGSSFLRGHGSVWRDSRAFADTLFESGPYKNGIASCLLPWVRGHYSIDHT